MVSDTLCPLRPSEPLGEGQTGGWTDGNYPRVLNALVPFGAVAQKQPLLRWQNRRQRWYHHHHRRHRATAISHSRTHGLNRALTNITGARPQGRFNLMCGLKLGRYVWPISPPSHCIPSYPLIVLIISVFLESCCLHARSEAQGWDIA